MEFSNDPTVVNLARIAARAIDGNVVNLDAWKAQSAERAATTTPVLAPVTTTARVTTFAVIAALLVLVFFLRRA